MLTISVADTAVFNRLKKGERKEFRLIRMPETERMLKVYFGIYMAGGGDMGSEVVCFRSKSGEDFCAVCRLKLKNTYGTEWFVLEILGAYEGGGAAAV